MKNFLNLLIKQLQILIFLHAGYKSYTVYDRIHSEYTQLEDQYKVIDENIGRTKIRNKQAKDFEKNLEASRARVEEIERQIEGVQKQLPNSISDTEILQMFKNEADFVNIKDIYLTPQKEEPRDFYYAKGYEIRTKGTFHQFLVYFERLGSQDRLLNVKSFNLTRSQEVSRSRFQTLNLQAVMEAFRYNAAYRPSDEKGEVGK